MKRRVLCVIIKECFPRRSGLDWRSNPRLWKGFLWYRGVHWGRGSALSRWPSGSRGTRRTSPRLVGILATQTCSLTQVFVQFCFSRALRSFLTCGKPRLSLREANLQFGFCEVLRSFLPVENRVLRLKFASTSALTGILCRIIYNAN